MGVYEVKARKGLIRARVVVEDDVIRDVWITGDFFIYPEEALWMLEERLRGVRIVWDEILGVIEGFFREHGVEAVGSSPRDFAEAVYCAATGGCGGER